ncbi:MAG: YdeI/OmpD-associated family protein [Clostridia bacterium]|nr:YdeI/OmpD-associated family protein [Clostridia bacterium]
MELLYTADRNEWRAWLEAHFETAAEIGLVYPMKGSGEPCILYNDAVEEALCFGWIDSTIKHTDPLHRAQRFTPRRKGSPYSQPNIERLKWLDARGMIHPKVRAEVLPLIEAEFVFPEDILAALAADPLCMENFMRFPEAYRRIRVAYVNDARKRPEEFAKRLKNLVDKTAKNKRIMGYGGIEKYYGEAPDGPLVLQAAPVIE